MRSRLNPSTKAPAPVTRDGRRGRNSFFTVASAEPPMLAFTSVGREDTLRNVEATGEFVVDLAVEPLLRQVNECATDFPPELGEFDAVGVRREPVEPVAPPRVADSPASLECRLRFKDWSPDA
jgi:flavin reductase (DIM6/NTAB) family NADH-FMN oxidoreductase RutF